MKKFIAIIICLIAFQMAWTQCPCTVKAEFDASDIRPLGKLEWKTTADFMITIENTGTCGWDKDKVWVLIETKVKPREANQSEVDKSFTKLVKHYMTSGSVTQPGETAGFKIRFDPPPYPGRYQIIVRFVADGSTLESAESRAIDWK